MIELCRTCKTPIEKVPNGWGHSTPGKQTILHDALPEEEQLCQCEGCKKWPPDQKCAVCTGTEPTGMYSVHAPVTMHHYHYQNWRAATRLLGAVLGYDLPSYWSHEFGEAWNMSRHGEDSPEPTELLPDKVDRYRKLIEHLLRPE